jgi:hypothetical protein
MQLVLRRFQSLRDKTSTSNYAGVTILPEPLKPIEDVMINNMKLNPQQDLLVLPKGFKAPNPFFAGIIAGMESRGRIIWLKYVSHPAIVRA